MKRAEQPDFTIAPPNRLSKSRNRLMGRLEWPVIMSKGWPWGMVQRDGGPHFLQNMPYGHMRANLQSFNPIDGEQATPLHQLHPSPMSMSKQGVAMVEGAGMWWASSVAGMLHDQIQGCLQSFSPIG